MQAFGEIIVSGRKFQQVEQAFDDLYQQMERGLDAAVIPLSQAMRQALQLVARKLEERHSSPWNGRVVNDKPDLQKRSGGMLRRIAQSIKVSGRTIHTLEGSIATGGFAIHEKGGTIRAKSAKYLTIPLPPAMDTRGVPLRKRARDWDNTFVARSKRGNLLIFRKEARRIVPLYLLKPSVYIPPRLGMEKTLLNVGLPYFDRKALEIISDAIG